MHTIVTKLDPKLDVISTRRFEFDDISLYNPTFLRILAFEFFVRKYTFGSEVLVNRHPPSVKMGRA